MNSQVTSDPIDHLLSKISAEAEAEYMPRYATFLQRVIARIVDTLVVVGAAYGLKQMLMGFIISDNNQNLGYVLDSIDQATPAIALMFYSMLYSPIMESTGGSLGKRIVRIKLVAVGKPYLAPFRNYMARSVIYLLFVVLSAPFLLRLEKLNSDPSISNIVYACITICFAPGFLSCLAFFISDHKQTWHDKISNVMCVKK